MPRIDGIAPHLSLLGKPMSQTTKVEHAALPSNAMTESLIYDVKQQDNTAKCNGMLKGDEIIFKHDKIT
jgi:hypothetical protein